MARRVLLIEDDSGMAKMLGDVLGDEGYVVSHAPTAARALSLVESAPPDLILLDLHLPDLDGLELCATLKAFHGDVPIVICSGADRERDLVAGLDLGADDFLRKPFSLREL